MLVRLGPGGRLDLHDLGLFALQQLVDLVHVLVGELLDAPLRRPLLVVADLAVADELLEVPEDVAAAVAFRVGSPRSIDQLDRCADCSRWRRPLAFCATTRVNKL